MLRSVTNVVAYLRGKMRSIMKKFTDYQLYMLEKGNITCSDIEKLYGDYVEGDLPRSLKGRLDAHIDDCGECQEFVSTYNLTIQLAKELGSRPMPTDAKNRLRERLNQRLGIQLPAE